MKDFIKAIPKAELHVHIEGTLEPELMFKFATRNNISLKFKNIDALRKAYNFHNLQAFLDIYYEGANVLQHEEDFYEMSLSYLEKLHCQNVLHAEIFFDPQTHTERNISLKKVVNGISKALADGKKKYGISSKLIMCFLRHLSEESAMKTLKEALSFKDVIAGVGLDSSEVGNPPSKFERVFVEARKHGFFTVAHAGEEGPPEYIWEALEKLKVLRIDHGVKCLEDLNLVDLLAEKQIPLTVCPLSNIKLGVFKTIKEHNFMDLLNARLKITINSDDPAYFGGNLNDNYFAVQEAFDLTREEIYTLAKNSFESAFLEETEKRRLLNLLKSY